MLFRKKTSANEQPAPHAGAPAVLDGHTAVLRVEQRAADPCVARAGGSWDRATVGAALRRAGDGDTVLGLLEGHAVMGRRVAGFTEGDALVASAPALMQLAERRLPFVLHHLARPGGEEAALDALASSGPFVFHASDVQEAADFALVARRLAEAALQPGLVLSDAATTGASFQSLLEPEGALVEAYLGRPGDAISAPAPSQELAFGTERRRVPVWLDLDRPVGMGVAFAPRADFLAGAAGKAFFLDHLGALADEAFARYAELTGRSYERVQGYRLDDAEYVVVAEGAVYEPLQEVVETLRSEHKLKAGILKVNVRRPFPAARVAALLRGRKGVAVLARALPGLSAETGLLREVRSAVDRAAENGRAPKGLQPYPGFDAYARPEDRPPLFEASYGDALAPSFADLCALFENMQPDGPGRRQVYLGTAFHNPNVRLPKVERLQQLIQKQYPNLERYTLAPSRLAPPSPEDAGLFALVAEADEKTSAVGQACAAACQAAGSERVRTHTDAAQGEMRPGRYATAHAAAGGRLPSPARRWDAAVVTSPFFWDEVTALKEGGLLVTHWDPEQAATLKSALGGSINALHRGKARLFYVDAHAVAADLSEDAAQRPWLVLATLFGAFLAKYAPLSGTDAKPMREAWVRALVEAQDVAPSLVEKLHQALERGADDVAELPTFDLVDEVSVEPEPEAPWTVRAERQTDGSVYDLGRFWDSAGYLLETGRPDRLLADPFLATRTMPARSSAIHDHAPFRHALPRLLPERCTACGACWVGCPDAALPVTVQDLETLIGTAFDRARAAGPSLTQLGRVVKHLALQAHKLFAADGSATYGSLGALLRDAFSALLDKMNPGAGQRQTLEEEFGALYAEAAHFPLVKTETFFDEPEGDEAGTGLAFSLIVNPDACKACGLCVDVCPEDALVMDEQTPDRLAEAREDWAFLRALPDVAPDVVAPFVHDDAPETLAYRLLDRRAYHAVLGGDLAEPGSGPKIATHLLAGLVESTLRPRVDRFVARVSDLMARIEKKIDATLHDAVHVDDVGSLADRLSGVEGDRLDLSALAPLLKDGRDDGIDRTWLARLTASYKELGDLKAAYVDGGHGDGRARMIAGLADADATRWGRTFPHNPFPFPWVCLASGGAAGLAEGLYEGVMRRMADGFAAVRRAELHLGNKYNPSEHDAFFASFGPEVFTEDERALCPPVLVLADSAATVDDVLNRSLPVKVLLVADGDEELGRGPGAGPARSAALAAVTHRDVFVLQSSIGAAGHLMKGFVDGLAFDGRALFHVYAPSPSRTGIAPEAVLRDARDAVDGRAFPLFSFDPSADGLFFDRFDLSLNARPDEDWPQRLGDDGEATGEPFTFADWAVRQARFRRHFTPLGPEHDASAAVPLASYLDLEERAREGKQPVVAAPDAEGERLAVSAEMVALTAWHRAQWHLLQSLPAHRPVLGTPAAEAGTVPPELLRTHAALTERLLAMSGFGPGRPADAALETDNTAS